MDISTTSTGAVISPCGRYRYRLWRRWAEGPHVLWLMLNPSTADDVENDPTISRCIIRTKALGHAGIEVANLYALRSTDPKALKQTTSPIGPENDAAILAAADGAALIVCGWGAHAQLGRVADVVRLLTAAGHDLYALTVSAKTGQPGHPLYLSYELQPTLWKPAKKAA